MTPAMFIAAILSSSAITALLTQLFNRKKTKAEGDNIIADGGMKLGAGWQSYALQQKKDKEELRKEFKEQIEAMQVQHVKEIENLKKEFALTTQAKDDRIVILEGKVRELEIEVARYKSMDHVMDHVIDTAKDVIHASVETVAEQIKKDIHSTDSVPTPGL